MWSITSDRKFGRLEVFWHQNQVYGAQRKHQSPKKNTAIDNDIYMAEVPHHSHLWKAFSRTRREFLTSNCTDLHHKLEESSTSEFEKLEITTLQVPSQNSKNTTEKWVAKVWRQGFKLPFCWPCFVCQSFLGNYLGALLILSSHLMSSVFPPFFSFRLFTRAVVELWTFFFSRVLARGVPLPMISFFTRVTSPKWFQLFHSRLETLSRQKIHARVYTKFVPWRLIGLKKQISPWVSHFCPHWGLKMFDFVTLFKSKLSWFKKKKKTQNQNHATLPSRSCKWILLCCHCSIKLRYFSLCYIIKSSHFFVSRIGQWNCKSTQVGGAVSPK